MADKEIYSLANSYPEMQGNPMDVKDHPDRNIPDPQDDWTDIKSSKDYPGSMDVTTRRGLTYKGVSGPSDLSNWREITDK